jgi:hypothetical protein
MPLYVPTNPAFASSPCHRAYQSALQTLDAFSCPTVLALAETFKRAPVIGKEAVTFTLHPWETKDAGLEYDDIIELADCSVDPADVKATVVEQIDALSDGTPICLSAIVTAPLPPDVRATLISLGKITAIVQQAYVYESVNCSA